MNNKTWSRDIILIILGAGLAFLGNYWLKSDSLSIPYFDKFISIDKSIISKKNLLSHDVELLVDNIKVEKVSKLNIFLLNYSNKYYEDFTLSIKLKPENEDIKILSAHAFGENNEKNLIKDLKSKEKNTFNYNVKIAKRTDAFDEFFKVTFFYEGDREFSTDDIIVTVLDAAPKVRDYDPDHSPATLKIKLRDTLYIVLIVLGAIIFLFFFFSAISRLTRGADRKATKRYTKSLVEATKNVPNFSNVNNIKESIIDLLYQNKKIKWEKKGAITRFIEGNVPPQKSDHEYDDT